MGNPGRTAGIVLAIIGAALILGGILAYIWGVPVTSGYVFTQTYMTYPFREMGTWLIGMGFASLVIGIILFALQDYLRKSSDIQKQSYYQPPQPQFQYQPEQQDYYSQQQFPEQPYQPPSKF